MIDVTMFMSQFTRIPPKMKFNEEIPKLRFGVFPSSHIYVFYVPIYTIFLR